MLLSSVFFPTLLFAASTAAAPAKRIITEADGSAVYTDSFEPYSLPSKRYPSIAQVKPRRPSISPLEPRGEPKERVSIDMYVEPEFKGKVWNWEADSYECIKFVADNAPIYPEVMWKSAKPKQENF